jgi:hypothetical protein
VRQDANIQYLEYCCKALLETPYITKDLSRSQVWLQATPYEPDHMHYLLYVRINLLEWCEPTQWLEKCHNFVPNEMCWHELDNTDRPLLRWTFVYYCAI